MSNAWTMSGVEPSARAGDPSGTLTHPAPGPLEFGEAESRVVAHTAMWTVIYGGLHVFSGLVPVVIGTFVRPSLSTVLAGLLPMLVGTSFMVAGTSLGAIRATQGRDMAHLVRGMRALKRALVVSVLLTAVGASTLAAGAVSRSPAAAAPGGAK